MMAFDIHQRVFEDGDYDEDAGLSFREDLMERIAAAPEGPSLVINVAA
jgi:hypothetical protein